ncbi:uracil-DNA glycosylase [Thalassotalea agarivorans]|uniref:Uracil-DNA glycosylase n=1 Tax=Thalassotalea agarivorans TaxID=349064 RepID=A0A1I0APQ5_THASX|nr:uracil-DNA glycosylase [Thalassotalea agarivorans]SES96154.1 Uracil-DNA glycosylase [Thalassotalea agarivorans]
MLSSFFPTNDWQSFFTEQHQKDYFKNLEKTLANKTAKATVYPLSKDIFSAFNHTSRADTKVVILGQDPYHGENQAHGLAFSVQEGVKVPPSLKNIYKALEQDDVAFTTPSHGYLVDWAKQGVMLLNAVLTVEQGNANAHAGIGWETFTDAVIAEINQQSTPCVFMLWGGPAQKKGEQIDSQKHLVLTAPHPSPLSAYRGFFDCHHFSLANNWLKAQNREPINWQLSEKQSSLF